MPRVIVQSNDGSQLMNEDVREVHLDSEQSAIQLLDRLEWAIREAEGMTATRPRRRRKRRPNGTASYTTPGIGS